MPFDEQSALGCCEDCGIVYALRGKLKGVPAGEAPDVLKSGAPRDSREKDRPEVTSVADATTPRPSSGVSWRCPDCDTEIRSENDSDLGFAKREHIREYHPNRSTA